MDFASSSGGLHDWFTRTRSAALTKNNEVKPPNNIDPHSYYFELPVLGVLPVNFVQICQENCWTNIPEAGPELENTAAVIDGENKAGWHVILICQYSWWSEVVWLCLSSDGLLLEKQQN